MPDHAIAMASFPPSAIVNGSRDAILAFTPDRVIRVWNHAAESLYGFLALEIIGQSRDQLLVPNFGEPQDLLSQTEAFETTRVRRNGSLVALSIRVSPVHNGCELIGFTEVARPLSYSDTLEYAVAQLTAILQNSDDAIVSESAEGSEIRSWNPAAERIYGYSASEVIGQPMFGLLPKALLPQEREILAKIQGGEQIHFTDTFRIHKDGHPVHVSLTVSPIRDSSGKVIGASHVARDISETRQLRNKLQISQRMEALGRLAGGVAHDFNNLLTVIRGYGALLQSSLQGTPGLQEMADEVMGASDKAAELTRQLLTFSRNKMVHLQPVDLHECLSKSLGLLRRLIGPNINMDTFLTSRPAIIQSDPGYLGQVMMNLAANARDAMPDGGCITIATDTYFVHEEHRQLDLTPGRYVRLFFSDTGVGMSSETRSRIFEPFFTTKDLGKGTGLGLATVYGIVRQSGGQIFVESALQCGTTFIIYFPSANGEAEEHKPINASTTHGTETILLVEDEASIRRLAVSVLRESGYTVLPATNAAEAMMQANSYSGSIPLLVTDVLMPGKNGQELATELTERYPGMRVIFISGFTQHNVMEQILSEPESTFLPKPFTPDQLLRKIREVLA